MSDQTPSIPVAVGIIVGLLASFVQSLGLTIQRKSHLQEEHRPLNERKKPIRRPLWLLGFAIFISSNLFGTVFQIGALPIVVLAPLGAVSLLWNALLSRLLLGDLFSPTTMIGTLLIATGATLIAVFGVVSEPNHSLDELLVLFARAGFVAYFVIIGVAVFGVLIVAHIVEYSIRRALIPKESISPPFSPVPSDYGTPQHSISIPFRSRLSDRKPPHIVLPDAPPRQVIPLAPTAAQQKSLTLVGLAYAACSGTLSGMCLLFAKCAVELLILSVAHARTGKGGNQFARFQSWVLVGGLGVAAILQLVYLNRSLTLAGPAIICPLAFCFYNISSIFDGLVFYSQFSRLQPYQIGLVTLGIVVLLVGVWSVSAIQPTGAGGVELGTWAEESDDEEHDDELEAGEGARLLGAFTDEPIDALAHITPRLNSDVFISPPTSPLSPRHRHHPRYGTLIPELAPQGAPAGFTIGIGASSPGFVIRSGSISHPVRSPMGRHTRSRSEGAAIEETLRDWEREPPQENQSLLQRVRRGLGWKGRIKLDDS